jgi:hypothetical protein
VDLQILVALNEQLMRLKKKRLAFGRKLKKKSAN